MENIFSQTWGFSIGLGACGSHVCVCARAFASVERMNLCTSIFLCIFVCLHASVPTCACVMRQMGNSPCAESEALCNVQP